MTAWVTQRQAADLLDLSVGGVAHLVATGRLRSNGRHYGGSLDLVDVEALAEERARAARAMEESIARRLISRGAHRARPPDDVHEWLSMGEAARLLGVTRQAVRQRCDRGKLPHEWSSEKRWVRRDLLELAERARAAQHSRSPSR